MFETGKLKARRNAAKREREGFQPLLDEAYQYTIPFRKSTKNSGTNEKRVDQVFDHTAIDAAFRFAGKFQQDFWPPGQDNFELAPGVMVLNQAEREEMAKSLGPIGKVSQAFFLDGDWDIAFHEMALDLNAGNGAILMNSAGADEYDKLWNPICVSIDELLWENGPNNKISAIFWDRKMSVRVLMDTWPEGRYGHDLKELFRTKPEDELEVHVDTIYDRKTRRWNMLVWCDKQETIIFSSQSRTCPWLTVRYFRVPGETYGRGNAMLAMPSIKTVNTVARLQLQAAAIAMLGIYTAVDDGVFNPDLAPLEPGVFWKVARNGGSLGPSINRFPDPRLDLSNLVLNDLRMSVKATMLDESLPPENAAVKSATEIVERVKRLAADYLGSFGRLVNDIVVQAVKRTIELAYNRGLLGNEIAIDQLLIQVKVKSPLAIARETARIEKIIQWLEMVLAILTQAGAPGSVSRIAHIEKLMTDVGRDMGVPAEYIVTQKEREAMDKQAAEQQAAQLAAQLAAGATGAG
jgi:hypothetical protein